MIMKTKNNGNTTRRGFMKMSAGAIAGMAANLPGDSYSEKSTHSLGTKKERSKRIPGERQPNVLIVMTDHARAESITSQSQCLTPNLDRLAADGVKFNRCYTPTSMCSPARASLMTGTYPSTHGVWDCTHTQRKEWVEVSPKLTHWAQRLSDNGYSTGYFGKWHVSQNKHIEDYGWQEYEIKNANIMHGEYIKDSKVISRKQGYKDFLLAAVRHDSKTNPHHPAYELGIEFIKKQATTDKPFCCFVSTREPGECMPPKSFWDMYDVKYAKLSPTLRDDLSGKSEILRRMQSVWKDVSENDWKKITTCYNAEMTFIDSEIGRIIQTLHDTGCYENTIILFVADHGQMLGAHGLVSQGIGLSYEETMNIPLIVRLPKWLYNKSKEVRGKIIDDALVSLLDVCPTILDLCGIETLPQVQSRSLRPLIEGTANLADWQEAYGEFFGQRFMYTQRMVWNGDWKYVFSPGGVDELYNLADDPYEKNNLAEDSLYREILLKMVNQMWRKMDEIGDWSLYNTDWSTLRTAPIGPR